MSGSVLVARLDSLGDVLVCGPAVRALAASADRLTFLAGPAGAPAARLLPGVDEVLTWPCPWIDRGAGPVTRDGVQDAVARVAAAAPDRAVVLTSFHQSALPTALLLRLAGVAHVTAVSTDYPGALLDVRLPEPPDAPEPLRMLTIARGAGADLPSGDDGGLRVRADLLPPPAAAGAAPYLVVHPGVTAAARAYPTAQWAEVVALLAGRGWQVQVTGTAAERGLVEAVAGDAGTPRTGDLDVAGLAALLRDAEVVLSANTGPAHLAAAVGTPVVSLFAPVVPAARWAPHGVPVALLGDQGAACRGTRAVTCPVPGHPCLSGVAPGEVADAAEALAARRPALAGAR